MRGEGGWRGGEGEEEGGGGGRGGENHLKMKRKNRQTRRQTVLPRNACRKILNRCWARCCTQKAESTSFPAQSSGAVSVKVELAVLGSPS